MVIRSEARRRWWQEPLLHFLILGAILFAAHHLLFGRSQSDYVTAEDAPIAQNLESWQANRGDDADDV